MNLVENSQNIGKWRCFYALQAEYGLRLGLLLSGSSNHIYTAGRRP